MIIDFQPDGAAVLTTPEPGAFLNIRWEDGDPSYFFIPRPIQDVSAGKLWINGLDISQEASIYDDNSLGYYLYMSDHGDPSVASFYVYTRELGNFNTELFLDVYTKDPYAPGLEFDTSIKINILNRPYIALSDSVNVYETSNIQVDGDTSYLVLRTNPKFSGNIKLVIDPSNNLFLDTFKISDILSNKLYRKQSVSGESVFSGDIRRVFSSMPFGELYRLDSEDTLNVSIPKTELYNQYNVNYSYGSRLFQDELYPEDYAMLAPLWINNTLPDYFAIFRIDGVVNEETYQTGVSLDGLAEKFLIEGELMESWGIKEGTPLGTYLRSHIRELNNVISPMFLSLSDPDLKDPDPNTWFGIAVDKGIIAGRSETTYFFDQKSSNFTDLNAFSSGGFERLNLLCPNIINMEYIFNDMDVSLYTMHRYYGLYLTENPLYQISYYAESPDSSISIISLDGKDVKEFFDSSIFNADGSIQSEYQNRLFTLDDINEIKRITNSSQIDGSNEKYIDQWVNKPGDNIFSVQTKKIEGLLPFISFTINEKLSSGEHLRIIDISANIIWEVYGIETDLLEAGESWTYATEYNDPSYPQVYRTAFSIKGEIEDQNEAIWNAWNVFQEYENTPFETYKKKDNGQSINIKEWAKETDFRFQRITAQTVDSIDSSTSIYDPSSNLNSAADYGDIEFYGNLVPTIEDFDRIKYDSSYGPINFEIFGDRMSIMIDIFNPEAYEIYSMDASVIDKLVSNILYLAPDSWHRLVQYTDVSTSINHSLRYMEDPTTVLDKIIMFTDYPIVTIGDIWNAYTVYPLTVSLMGINPVKDFDYTVYDSSTLDFKSEYWYTREGDEYTFKLRISGGNQDFVSCVNSFRITEGSGEITIDGSTVSYNILDPSVPFLFNTFGGEALVKSVVETIVTYSVLDGSANFKSYKEGYSEEYIEDYYQDPSISLKYGLIVPTVTKWQGTGNDCRNNPFRLILDASILDVSTNFIPFEDSFEGEIFYPSFKYMYPGERNWEDYIFFDINDSIEYSLDGEPSIYTTFKNLMVSDPSLDIFSKLVYSNNKVDGTKLRSSIAYYNNYKNTVDAIVNGLSLSFKIEENARNIIDIQDWDRFRISGIAVPSRNRDNNKTMEVFINENTETILLVWYQGNDVLNYSYRNSSTMPGKGLLDPAETTVEAFPWRAFNDDDFHFSHIKTPFGVNNSTLSSNIFNIYGTSVTYDGSIASPFFQSNLNFGDDLFSVFNAYDGNVLFGSGFEFYDRAYETFRQYVNYTYTKSESTYGDIVTNMAYSYMENTNLYADKTCDLDTLKYIFEKNRVEYYIFRNNKTYRSSNFTYNPVTISINNPRSYNGMITYNGWYRPKFKNILEFSYNEDQNIIETTEKDFTLGNTDLKSYDRIPQLWFNKIVEEVISYDVSAGNAIDYEEDYNPFKSQWDANYYYLYDQGSKTPVDGYNSTLELPSYFASKLVKLPSDLVLDTWTDTSSDEQIGDGKKSNNINKNLYLSYNLTRNIIGIFKNKDSFVNNWSDLTQSDNVIDGYIKKTILNYYNISKPKIKVKIWTKPYRGSGDRLATEIDDDFTLWEGANVDGELIYKNDEYIYTITVKNSDALTYYTQFTLFEK